MPHRFHIPPEKWNATALALEGDEAKHCSQVLRYGVGDEAIVFNGAGDEAVCRIAAIKKNHVSLESLSFTKAAPPRVRITLAPALIKNEAWEWLLEKATELGTTEIMPVITDRSVVRLSSADAARKTEKWRRIFIETGKQCGRAWLPELHEPRAGLNWLAAEKARWDLIIVASLAEQVVTLPQAFSEFRARTSRPPCTILILAGPEGDFSPDELARIIESGATAVTLGENVLRAETASLAALAVVMAEAGRY